MRVVVLALLVPCALVTQVSAQTPAWAEKIFAGSTSHDFGTQPRGAQLQHSFKMTNIYKVPLEIVRIDVSCGCLTATPSTKILQPNESAVLQIKMDASRFTGYKHIRISVTVGPEFVSTATLNVTATARQDVVFNPGEIDFGVVGRGQSPSRHIDIEYAGALDWQVNEIIKTSSAPFELKVQELAGRGRGYRIFATLKPDAAAGKFKQDVVLKTNDPSSPVLIFHVVGNVQATLHASPGNLQLAGLKVGDAMTRKVIVRGSRPFRITGIDGLGEGLSVDLPQHADNSHILDIRFRPTRPGEVHRQLVIRTDLGSEAVTVTVDASAGP